MEALDLLEGLLKLRRKLEAILEKEKDTLGKQALLALKYKLSKVEDTIQRIRRIRGYSM